MKSKFLLSLVACSATLGLSAASQAQDAPPAPATSGTNAPMHAGGHHGGGAMMLQHLTTELGLSADQQATLKPILETSGSNMMELRKDTSMSKEDRMAKMKEMRESTNSQIVGVLTADQQAKYAAMQEKMRNRRKAAAGGAAGTTSATPSASPSATP